MQEGVGRNFEYCDMYESKYCSFHSKYLEGDTKVFTCAQTMSIKKFTYFVNT